MMKNILKKKNFIWLVGLVTIAAFISCETNDDSDGDSTISAAVVTNIAVDGNWRVSNYNDDGDDETSDFNGFTFTFNTDGSLIAESSNRTLTGTWAVDDSSNSSDDDGGNSDTDFIIFFQVSEDDDFDDLVDDWDIIEVTNTKIELIDISGGNGGTDRLTFTKN